MTMLPQDNSGASGAKLESLLGYLDTDHNNRNLLEDACLMAFDAGRYALSQELLDRREALAPLTPSLVNLRGLLQMSSGEYEKALDTFRSLNEADTDPTLRYNIAYAYSLGGRYEEAADGLTSDVLAAVPAAVTLIIRVLHHLGRLDEAITLGEMHLRDTARDHELPGALCEALFDANRMDGVREIANQYPDLAETLTARGILALETGADSRCYELFQRALSLQPGSGRTKLGVGLWHIANQQFDEATQWLADAAATLRVHPGSWVAAGWAHLLHDDLARAADAFDLAWRLDRGFAEAPGGLAIVRMKQRRIEEAQHLATVARRLDEHCLSAKYAQTLAASNSDDHTAVKKLIETSLSSPIDNSGRTLGEILYARSPINEKSGSLNKGAND